MPCSPHSETRKNDISPESFSEQLSGLRFAELHRHLEGSIRVSWLPEVAKLAGIELPSQDPKVLRNLYESPVKVKHVNELWPIFDRIGELFCSRDAVKWITAFVLRDTLKENISYLELRFSPLYMALSHNLSQRDVMEGVIEGVSLVRSEHPELDVNLILIIERQRDISTFGKPLLKLAAQYLDRKEAPLVALDLANDELNHPPEKFKDIFLTARDMGLRITVHAGEGGGPENVRRAVLELGAERIGHGFTSHLDPEVMEMLRVNRIPLEVCLTSNDKAAVVTAVKDHPLPRFLEAGVPVTISTDDPGLFDCDLPGEHRLLVEPLGLKLAEIRQIMLNSFDYAFTANDEQRARLLALKGRSAYMDPR